MAGGSGLVGPDGAPLPSTTPESAPAAAAPDSAADDAKKNPLLREHSEVFAAAEVDAEVDARLMQQAAGANFKGFRPGQAPVSFLRQRFGAQYRAEYLAARAQDAAIKHAEAAKESPAGRVEITDIKEEPAGWRVDFRFEVMPEVKPPSFAEKIKNPTLKVGEADVDRAIEQMRARLGDFHDVDRAAQAGDGVRLDYDATAEGGRREEAKGRVWRIDEKILAPELVRALTGAKAGDEVEALVETPAAPDEGEAQNESQNESQSAADSQTETNSPNKTAGQKIDFKIKVHAVCEFKSAEMNADFMKKCGAENDDPAAFRQMMRARLENEVEGRLRALARQRCFDALLHATPPFPLPQGMLINEMAILYENARAEAEQLRLPQNVVDPRSFAGEAARRVALGLLMAAAAKRENLQVNEARVEKMLQEAAAQGEEGRAMAQAARANPEHMQSLRLADLEEQVADWAMKTAGAEDAPISIDELWGRQ